MTLHFKPHVVSTSNSFEKVLESAKDYISSLSEAEKEKLKEALDHGAGNLTSRSQLKAYLHAYGAIHQAKLQQAFENIPNKVWSEGEFSIVDYGCGQGIAEMVLADFIRNKFIDNDVVTDITLIEPSRSNLQQSVEHTDAFYVSAEINAIQKTDDQIVEDDIRPKAQTVIHILSNVVDLDCFSGEQIIDILSRDKEHNNIVVCVSPYYQENSRGKRMEEFGNRLQGYTRHYKFEKHTDEWDKNYSCQIHIYVSSYY